MEEGETLAGKQSELEQSMKKVRQQVKTLEGERDRLQVWLRGLAWDPFASGLPKPCLPAFPNPAFRPPQTLPCECPPDGG